RCPGTPSVTDIDGSVYYTVQIGTQCWTQSNLKVSKYRNGDNIPTGLTNTDWQNATSGAYAIYNNDPVNDGLYGKLYNHYAVTDGRGLCPTGWHVPSDAEWTTLENQLGGSSVAGGALKSTATQPTLGGWTSPNTGATNSSGFTAPPGGQRNVTGEFILMSNYGYWWSSSSAWFRYLSFFNSYIFRDSGNRAYGVSVRCLKD
ncbi:MAG: fibrobacter succinogenes major paralogous domain-containing protein, partial [Bacteroidota bacterium]